MCGEQVVERAAADVLGDRAGVRLEGGDQRVGDCTVRGAVVLPPGHGEAGPREAVCELRERGEEEL